MCGGSCAMRVRTCSGCSATSASAFTAPPLLAKRSTGPEGDQPRGFWDVDEVEPPHRLVFRDGFANEDGSPNTELPMTTARVTIQEIGGGKTRMSIESEFPTVEAMEQLAGMGMEEGLTQAVGQIDAILAEDPAEAGGGRR